MIKGTATLKLINAETGEEEKSVTSDNMVTNAITNLLNPPMWALTAGCDFGTLLSQIMPICTKALGGVLLWDNTIFEDVNTILPPMDINCVGHAGGAYSGTLSRRGSYNSAESGYIDDDSGAHVGYRHVWDFATNKANGTIKSLSLTHLNGGNSGYQTMDTNALGRYSWGKVMDKPGSYSNTRMAGKTDDTMIIFATSTSSTSCMVDMSKYIDTTNINMFDTNGIDPLYTKTFNVSLEYSGYEYSKNTYALIGNKLHGCSVKSESGNKASIRHFVIDLQTQTKESETVITTAAGTAIYYPLAAFYSAGSYYLLSRKTNSSSGVVKLQKISADGTCSDDILPPDNNWAPSSGPTVYGAKYATSDIISLGNYMIQGDKVLWQSYYSANSVVDGFIQTENPCYRYNEDSSYVNIEAFLGYLATINNLPEPIEKTDQQTLKVIYEIRHEEG